MYQFYKGTLHQQLSLDRQDFARFERYVAARMNETQGISLEQHPGMLRFSMPVFGNRWSRTTGGAMMWLSNGRFEFNADQTVTYVFYVHKLFLAVLIFIGLIATIGLSLSGNILFAVPFVVWIVLIFGINTWVIYKAQKRMFESLETQFLTMKQVFQ